MQIIENYIGIDIYDNHYFIYKKNNITNKIQTFDGKNNKESNKILSKINSNDYVIIVESDAAATISFIIKPENLFIVNNLLKRSLVKAGINRGKDFAKFLVELFIPEKNDEKISNTMKEKILKQEEIQFNKIEEIYKLSQKYLNTKDKVPSLKDIINLENKGKEFLGSTSEGKKSFESIIKSYNNFIKASKEFNK